MSRLTAIVLVICVATGIYKYQDRRVVAAQVGEGLVMYSTADCHYCAKARKWLDKYGVPYRECDIEAVRQCGVEWTDLGGDVVPLFLYKGEVHHGYSSRWLDQTFLKPS